MIMKDANLLLNAKQINLKIQRLSNEAAERYYNSKSLYVFGIEGQGYKLAERIVEEVKPLIQIPIYLNKINIDKVYPIESVKISDKIINEIKNKDVLLIDDVLNSGRTLFYAMQVFVEIPIRSLRVLVLVNRGHQQFPVYSDFVGMTLSTTYQNHIEADLNNKTSSQVILYHK